MAPLLPPHVAAYLDDHHVMTLASSGADGPWAAAVFFARQENALLFMSSPHSRHCRNLAADPRCAAAVQANEPDWAKIKGVQLSGRVAVIGSSERARAQAHYAAKFPLLGHGAAVPPAIAAALLKVGWYRLQIEQLCFIDNSRGFGHRELIDLRDA